MDQARDDVITRAVRALLAAPRVLRIYPAGHQRVEAQYDELGRLFSALIQYTPDGCAFTVRGMRIFVNELPWESAPDLATSLAFKLRRRRIRRLALRPGLTREEIVGIVSLFCMDHKHLLRAGALDEFHKGVGRHMEVDALIGGEFGDGGMSLPAHVAEALEECLEAPRTVEIIGRLRDGFSVAVGDQGADTFDNLLSSLFARAEWRDLSSQHVREGFYAFLTMVEDAMFRIASTNDAQRIASIKALFEEVRPTDLLAGKPTPQPDLEHSFTEYTTAGVSELRAQTSGGDGTAVDNVRQALEEHDSQENALLIVCELMMSAGCLQEYKARRQSFLASFRDNRFSSEAIARILRFIAIDMPAPRHEHRDNLVSDVIDGTEDEEALVLFLGAMTKLPDVARPILNRLIVRPSPFALLVRLIRAPLLESFQNLLTDKFIEAGRLKNDTLARWAREDRSGSLFLPEIFDSLLARAPELLGPICKDILTAGSYQERSRLVARLKAEGSDIALHLLVLGLPFGEEACDQLLLEALASFPHPLAVSALREVVHRNNKRDARTAEASAALQSLRQLGTGGAREFLWEILQRKSGVLPFYRKELRQIAALVLAGEEPAL